jgi:hypothetical protein
METPSSTADLTNNVRNMNVGTVHDTRSTAMDVIEESPRNNVFKRASLPPVETAQSDLNGDFLEDVARTVLVMRSAFSEFNSGNTLMLRYSDTNKSVYTCVVRDDELQEDWTQWPQTAEVFVKDIAHPGVSDRRHEESPRVAELTDFGEKKKTKGKKKAGIEPPDNSEK